LSDASCDLLRNGFSEPLPRAFYARSATIVAPELLNCILVSASPDGLTAGRVVETEAYTQDDAASHCFRGRTPRNRVMFGTAGHAYVYFTYGMHYCLNAVTGTEGQGEAVLIRAIEPLMGTELMFSRRGLSVERLPIEKRSATRAKRLLGAGPAVLCRSLGISASHNGADLTEPGSLWICAVDVENEFASGGGLTVVTTTRIGITKAVELKRRFLIAADPYISRKI